MLLRSHPQGSFPPADPSRSSVRWPALQHQGRDSLLREREARKRSWRLRVAVTAEGPRGQVATGCRFPGPEASKRSWPAWNGLQEQRGIWIPRAWAESFEVCGGSMVSSVIHPSRSQEALPGDVGLSLLGPESDVWERLSFPGRRTLLWDRIRSFFLPPHPFPRPKKQLSSQCKLQDNAV